MTGLPRPFSYPVAHILQSEPHRARTMVWALSRSLAATKEIDVSFSSSGYLDVSVPRVPFHTLWIGVWILEVCSSGFPHSEISGSKDICSSPKLFAAYHVFHRLSVPRHPPCALLRLTFICIALHTRALIRYFVLSTDLSVFCLLFITKTDCQLFGYLGCLNFYFYFLFLSIDSIEYLRLD